MCSYTTFYICTRRAHNIINILAELLVAIMRSDVQNTGNVLWYYYNVCFTQEFDDDFAFDRRPSVSLTLFSLFFFTFILQRIPVVL